MFIKEIYLSAVSNCAILTTTYNFVTEVEK